MFTGDHWAAGTDANMFITMNGTRGDSGRRLLYKCLNNRVKFKRGQVCYSLFYCNIYSKCSKISNTSCGSAVAQW